jgi:hypothetical protein
MGDLYQGKRDPENDPLRPPRIGEACRYVPFSNRTNNISNNNNKEHSKISRLKNLWYGFGREYVWKQMRKIFLMKSENVPIGVLVLHHRFRPQDDPAEILPRNYDIIGRKWCWRKVASLWENYLYESCGIAEKSAAILSEIYGIEFVPIGSEDLFHFHNDANGFESLFETFKDLLASAYEKRFAIYYFDPNERLNPIASPQEYESLSKEECVRRVQIVRANYLKSVSQQV